MRARTSARQLEDVAARLRVAVARRNRRAERDERARPVADGVAHHLGQLARERPLALLDALPRQDVIFEHQVVGDRRRDDHQIGASRRQRRMDQPGLGRLQLAAVAPAAFRIEEQVVLLQDLGDVRLQRDQVRGILRVPADRNRAGHVPMEQAERAAEQIDPRGDERRAHAVVVEHERLDEIIGVALVIRGVDDAMGARRVQDVVEVLRLALDLPENGIERMLQRAINRIPLGGPQFLEIACRCAREPDRRARRNRRGGIGAPPRARGRPGRSHPT